MRRGLILALCVAATAWVGCVHGLVDAAHTAWEGTFGRGARPAWQGRFGRGSTYETMSVEVVRDSREVVLTVHSDHGERTARLGATLTRPIHGDGPGIVIVPGAGNISRRGTRPGDGVRQYPQSVDVSTAWAEALAQRGARVLTYDKRSCGPNDDPVCGSQPQDDIDAQGPAAWARDVDAACAVLRAAPGFNGQLILWAHGQAAQVALSSSCARDAAAVVLVAPIPRAVDRVIVEALRHRQRAFERTARTASETSMRTLAASRALELKNQAATREAEFSSMAAGRFAPHARVGGATLEFWRGWIALTARTPELARSVQGRVVVVHGDDDVQYAPEDRRLMRTLAPRATLELKGADHHVLSEGALSQATVEAVCTALDSVLVSPSS